MLKWIRILIDMCVMNETRIHNKICGINDYDTPKIVDIDGNLF